MQPFQNPIRFNSMKVRLKHRREHTTEELAASFNSMKVRLTPPSMLSPLASAQFQFHEGPIKTRRLHAAASARTFVSIP